MDGTPVLTISHEEFVSNWRESLRLRATWLTDRTELEWFWAFEYKNRLFKIDPADLIPGLLDDLVEIEIWPRIRRYFEDVGTDLESAERLLPIRRDIRALSSTNQKWRFLVQSSKSWAAMKLLEHDLMPIEIFWNTEWADMYFHRFMRNLPPIDVFSRDRIERLYLWYQCWYDMNKEDREMCLQLYHDPVDKLGRLEEWVKERETSGVMARPCIMLAKQGRS